MQQFALALSKSYTNPAGLLADETEIMRRLFLVSRNPRDQCLYCPSASGRARIVCARAALR